MPHSAGLLLVSGILPHEDLAPQSLNLQYTVPVAAMLDFNNKVYEELPLTNSICQTYLPAIFQIKCIHDP